MKPFRVSIAATLGVVAVCALGAIGLREGKPLWASLAFCMALAFLLVATLRGTVGPAASRPGPLGFAVFGWVYLATVFGPWGRLELPQMPQSWGVDAALERLHTLPEYEESFSNGTWQANPSTTVIRINGAGPGRKLKAGSVPWPGDANSFRQSAHALRSLAFGIVGLFAARWIARRGEIGSA